MRDSGNAGIDRRAFVLRFEELLPSALDSISPAVERVIAIGRESGCLHDASDVEIALREALANAVIHGNAGNPRKRVRLRCYCDPRQGMLLVIRDEGKGFDPDGIPDPRDGDRLELPHGRGILLMRELMDHAEHRRGGREVVLYKGSAGRPGPRSGHRSSR